MNRILAEICHLRIRGDLVLGRAMMLEPGLLRADFNAGHVVVWLLQLLKGLVSDLIACR